MKRAGIRNWFEIPGVISQRNSNHIMPFSIAIAAAVVAQVAAQTTMNSTERAEIVSPAAQPPTPLSLWADQTSMGGRCTAFAQTAFI